MELKLVNELEKRTETVMCDVTGSESEHNFTSARPCQISGKCVITEVVVNNTFYSRFN